MAKHAPSDVRLWAGRTQSFLTAVEHRAFACLTGTLQTNSDHLLRLLPSTEGFLNDAKFLPAPAKKTLLQNKNRVKIAELSQTLYDDLDAAEMLWAELGHSQEFKEAFPFFDESKTVSLAADRVVDVTACMAVLFERGGPQQVAEAKTILSAASYLP